MKVNKREFLKMLGLGATGAAVGSTAPPKIGPNYTPKLEDPPTPNKFYAPDEWYDAVDAVEYDRIVFPAGLMMPKYFAMFQASFGTQCPYTGVAKGLEHTSLSTSGGFPAPCSFWVKRIIIALPPDTTKENLALIRSYGWRFYLCQKMYASGPCALDVQKGSFDDLIHKRLTTTRHSLQFDQMKGLYIPKQMPFYQEFQTQLDAMSRVVSPSQPLDLTMAIEGVKWRAVQ